MTVTVDGYKSQHGAASPPIQYPEHHWRLPNTDPRNEGKFLFRLHTLDIYFWTKEDANSFVDIVGKLLQQQQLEILDAPSAQVTHEHSISPVVQQLENVAFQDPAYHNGQTRNSGPAIPFSPPQSTTVRQTDAPKSLKAEDATAYQPLAYNPAAPAAPEPIKHREKTPPPPESETGTGLAAAAYHDETHAALSSGALRQSSITHPPYGHTPPSGRYASPHQDQVPLTSYVSPPISIGHANSPLTGQTNRTSSVSYFPHAPPQTGGNTPSPYTNPSSYIPPPPPSSGSSPAPFSKPTTISINTHPQAHNAHLYGQDLKAPDSPATEILGNSYVGGPAQPLQHLQPQYADYLETHHQSPKPEGGYSDYQYNQSQQHKHHPHSNEYDVHNQVYRPTEEEAHKHKHRKHSESQPGQAPGKLEQKAEKVEKGVNRLFKRLEKKIG